LNAAFVDWVDCVLAHINAEVRGHGTGGFRSRHFTQRHSDSDANGNVNYLDISCMPNTTLSV